MKLYTVPAAPNPTKVMLYIAEREVSGTDMGIEQVRVNTLKGEQIRLSICSAILLERCRFLN
jgi:hypothetical protein